MSDLGPNDIGLKQGPEGKKGKCLGRRKRMMVYVERGSKHPWKAHGAKVYLVIIIAVMFHIAYGNSTIRA